MTDLFYGQHYPHPFGETPAAFFPQEYPISLFDLLSDDVLRRIFSCLTSDQKCKCALVCRRWYTVIWDPVLWTNIWINSSEVDTDKAVKTLTKRLSYETPTICAIVERINLSGCERLTDKGLNIIAKRCPELRYLELQGCPNITNIALFEVVSNCVNLEHLNVAGKCEIIGVYPSSSCLSLSI
jgi:F-box/leucine-rich repeat protein 7